MKSLLVVSRIELLVILVMIENMSRASVTDGRVMFFKIPPLLSFPEERSSV
jgi:hypothetical protein